MAVVCLELSPVTELLKLRRKKQSKKEKDTLYYHLFKKAIYLLWSCCLTDRFQQYLGKA